MQETYASTSAPVISDEFPACPENKLPPLHRSSHHTDWRADLFPMAANSNERGEFEYRAGSISTARYFCALNLFAPAWN